MHRPMMEQEVNIGRFTKTAWVCVFSFCDPPSVVACAGACTQMRQLVRQPGVMMRIIKEQFGMDAGASINNGNDNNAGDHDGGGNDGNTRAEGVDLFQLYALVASQRSLRRAHYHSCPVQLPPRGQQFSEKVEFVRGATNGCTTMYEGALDMLEPDAERDPPVWVEEYEQDERPLEQHIYKQVDQLVARTGARIGDVIDFKRYRCTTWNVVGRNHPNSHDDTHHLLWNADEVGNIPFLITKHVRNAMWMFYDLLLDQSNDGARIWLARDDDFVVALLGGPLPEGIAMIVECSNEEREIEQVVIHNQIQPLLVRDIPQTRAFLQLRRTEIPAAETANYRSLASRRRGNCLAVWGQGTGFRYELDMDDEQTAEAVQHLRDGTSPFLEGAKDATHVDPWVMVYVRNIPEPQNDEEWQREDERVESFHRLFPARRKTGTDEYNRTLFFQSTTGEVDADIEKIRSIWVSPALEFRVSQPIAQKFSTGIHRHGKPAATVVEDSSTCLTPGVLACFAARTRPLREVAFEWKDYWDEASSSTA